ncbi:C2 domain-containing protein At1g53590-like isoform X2 [Phalaenopsis equestris]|uniref:C2 domain-containing protein At1g53590-like isoform X2 n=1 Tax=Phalaenopsis equestris TaxID=78828 RepID=UPI0009E4F6A8|nr:C2 domain-containing protein At1g53590-like isoform X2 [Phalaenopsis equestris]
MAVGETSIVYHVAVVLFFLYILDQLDLYHPFAFFISFLYLCMVNERCSVRLWRKLQNEERKQANKRRLLADSESVTWLNHTVEKVWPLCLEQIASQQFLLPIIPWFLDKFKPWTAKKTVVQHLYLGRSPPMFTEVRVHRESADDDHLLLELGLNFLAAEDMSAVIAVKLRKRLGFGIWAKMHVKGMRVEGKVLVGVKFIQRWPFIGRVRVCFIEPPYIQIIVKPIFHHGIDVTDLPGIASWLDKIIDVAFERTLVEPNMLVIDAEKFASAEAGSWFTVDVKSPIAFARVEIIEAVEMQLSDSNGPADPYVKGHLGPYRFQTKIQKKTVSPKWLEEFKVPITSWEACNKLTVEVHEKDHIFDNLIGSCSINITDLRSGQRHDKWLTLKTGKLRLAITITGVELDKNSANQSDDENDDIGDDDSSSVVSETTSAGSNPMAQDSSHEVGKKILVDNFEPKNIEYWLHHPGYDAPISWESGSPPKSLESSHNEAKIIVETHGKIHGDFHKHGIVIKPKGPKNNEFSSGELERPMKGGRVRERAVNIMKHAGKSAHKLKDALKRKVHRKFREEDEADSNWSDVSFRSNSSMEPKN